jgi:hypothetical protein
MAGVPKDVIARTAALLRLEDARSSFAIEGEQPPLDRLQRWGLAIGEAGRHPMDFDELLRLQNIVIGDPRFVHIGLRVAGGFVGEHDRATRLSLPDHISARPRDLPSLLDGMIAFEQGPGEDLDAVIEASTLAFGFVYVHPLEDGNVRVTNDTGDFYRFFDATPHAEFIYACVLQTIEHDLPEEARVLQRYDQFCFGLRAIVDMPDRTMDLRRAMTKTEHVNASVQPGAREHHRGERSDERARRSMSAYFATPSRSVSAVWNAGRYWP